MIGYTSRQSARRAAARRKMPGNFRRTGFLLIARSQSFGLRHPAEVGKKLSVSSSQFSAFIRSNPGRPECRLPTALHSRASPGSMAFTTRWIVSEGAVIQGQSLKVTGRVTSTVCRLYGRLTQAIVQFPIIIEGRFSFPIGLK
jgi:hypothetical protein